MQKTQFQNKTQNKRKHELESQNLKHFLNNQKIFQKPFLIFILFFFMIFSCVFCLAQTLPFLAVQTGTSQWGNLCLRCNFTALIGSSGMQFVSVSCVQRLDMMQKVLCGNMLCTPHQEYPMRPLIIVLLSILFVFECTLWRAPRRQHVSDQKSSSSCKRLISVIFKSFHLEALQESTRICYSNFLCSHTSSTEHLWNISWQLVDGSFSHMQNMSSHVYNKVEAIIWYASCCHLQNVCSLV